MIEQLPQLGSHMQNATKFIAGLSSLLKACKSFFSKRKDSKEKIIIKDQKKIEDILPELEKGSKNNPEKNPPVVNEFLKDFDIIREEGVYKIIPRAITNLYIVPKIKSFKDIEASQRINIIPFSSAESYEYYRREPKELPKNLKANPSKFSKQFQSLLALSSSVKELIKLNKKNQAYEIKRAIKESFYEEGIRFCNCYSAGYVETYLKYLKDLSEEEIENKMVELSKKPIFFISNPSFLFGRDEKIKRKIDQTKNMLVSSMNNQKPYLALHGLGTAAEIAEEVSKLILNTNADNEYESLKIDRNRKVNSQKKIRDFSYVWYTEEGKEFYEIFKILFT